MARKIVILAQREGPGKETEIAVAFWLDVTVVSRRPFYAVPDAVSAVPDASPAETDAIRTGVVVERVNRYARAAGTSNAQIKTYLEARYAEEQAALSADGTYRYAGTTWDGATWTNVVND